MITIGPGDVLPIKSLRVVMQDGKGWAEFKSPRGQCFVVMLLGKETIGKDTPKLDPIRALHDLGWKEAVKLPVDCEPVA